MFNSEIVIFDTDMGSDDVWALYMLIKSERKYNVKILGITIVHGNTSVEHGVENALRVLSSVDRLDITVYKGATEPIVKDSPKFFYHGKNGFGDVSFSTTPDMSVVSSENAVNFMYRVVKENPKKVTLLCVGPLTNVALAMKTFSDFSELVKDIFVMGGNYHGIGNCTSECAEFNFFSDPEAAYVVLNKSKCRLTLLPWEACMRENIDISINYRFNEIGNIKSFVTEIMNPIDEAIYISKKEFAWNPCDAFLVAVFLEKDKVIRQSKEVVIYHVTGSQKQYNITVVEYLNSDICKNLLLWTATP